MDSERSFKIIFIVLLMGIIWILYTEYDLFNIDFSQLNSLFKDKISNDVFVEVNGITIREDEFKYFYNSLLQADPNLSEEQALSTLISQAALISEKKQEGLTVDEQEIDQIIERNMELGGEDQFKNSLELMNLSKESFKEILTKQVYLQRIFNEIYENVSVSEQEINSFAEIMSLLSNQSLEEMNLTDQDISDYLTYQYALEILSQEMTNAYERAEIKFLKKGYEEKYNLLNLSSDNNLESNIASDSNGQEEQDLEDSSNSVISDDAVIETDSEKGTNIEIKECLSLKGIDDIDVFLRCDEDCSEFTSQIKENSLSYISVNSSDAEGLLLISECLSDVYFGFVPEIICINNGKSLYENFDQNLETFLSECKD